MAPPVKKASTSSDKPVKKTRSGGGKKKLSEFNKFMKTELSRLKETEPDITHQERFKMATANWKNAKPKKDA
ncbi:hypothetical protein BD626DRAFT_566480 [Schizophyllum amplum]|uniref:YABBY protein C-terminal domain-containing protein n=1 Tax=Schizophyllum amplum TaxID=97359 RepID=A0A550CLZ4_9AGAR|nr:hypothetical protein BD626DRAFT_566480 [Auriculariopsis ampla]